MLFAKSKPIVSPKIRQSAKGELCTIRKEGVCTHDRKTTVFAHLNTKFKGMGNKSPDIFGVYACAQCHYELDKGRVLAEDQLRALIETLMCLVRKELIGIK